MLRIKTLKIICLLALLATPLIGYADNFIATRKRLEAYSDNPDVVMVASTGRSGSTMLTAMVKKYDTAHLVLKTHLLPPDQNFKGKIIFIFSNPDKAAESALYMLLHNKSFAKTHFYHVETADLDWLKKIGGPRRQNGKDNLLAYDALGTYEHLKIWLFDKTQPTDPDHAQILAIKFENLWDKKTIQAIKDFLGLTEFKLPTKKTRGRKTSELYTREMKFRKKYNLGTDSHPRYAAYDEARILWEQAPPFQYLNVSDSP